MKEKLKAYWRSLPPERKRRATVSLIAGIVILFGLLAYELRGTPLDDITHKTKEKSISLKPTELERSAYLESKKEAERVARRLSEFERRMNDRLTAFQREMEKRPDAEPIPANITPQPLPKPPGATAVGRGERMGGRPLGPSRPLPPPPPPRLKKDQEGPEYVGGIEFVSAPAAKEKPGEKTADKKKEETIYLPPSFMEASLISGLDAPTVENAKGNPMPALLRVKAPAVLPNRVKANLKGCFVIASGYGDLAAERAYLRLDTLSCISKNGGSVIDQQVKGFVVDVDGKIGLRGRVVSKMGSTIARSMVAGFFGGVGDVLRLSGTTTSTSALGTTQMYDTEKLAEIGIGSGLGQAAKEIQKFYLELARQTMPVIEVGATKQVTLVIQEGADLKIRDACVGVEEGCG
ncbi:MAG: TraB/VirB10 family protein [Candidatus Nitrospinota bacterium M3_3B_026]